MVCNSVMVKHSYYPNPLRHGICISNSGNDVKASIEQGEDKNGYGCNGCRFDWIMYLQREEGGSWKNIASREGYVVCGPTAASCSQSHRTFTNVRKTGNRIRLAVTFRNAQGAKIFYSPIIRR